jgi:DNA polymerase III alpha subunit (gram-positive type)
MTRLAIVDIETTGLDSEKHQILEYAACLLPENDWVHFSLPIDTALASDQALEVNEYYERRTELLSIEEHPYEAAELIHQDLKGRIFVGNNPQFDARFIAKLLDKYDLQPSWNYHLVDLKALVAGSFRIAPPWSTADIAKWIGVPLPDNAHTAIADVEWNVSVYTALNLRNSP